MRSRTLREGSLGLFILLGFGLFGGLAFWLKGVNLGRRSYQFVTEFTEVTGVQTGASVRYRGVVVGKIAKIEPGINGVDITVEIDSTDLHIPRTVSIEANQGGLIGETTIDITPTAAPIAQAATLSNPISPDCDKTAIVCDGSRVRGQMGVSFPALLRASTRFSEAFSQPEFVDKLTKLTENTADAAVGISALTDNLSKLSQSLDKQLNTLSASAVQTTGTVGQAADQLSLTAGEIAQLASTVNGLVNNNRSNLVGTLDNVNQMSVELKGAAESLAVLIDRAGATTQKLDIAAIAQNTEQLSENAVRLSENAVRLSDNAAEVSDELRTNLDEIAANAVALSANAAQASANVRDVTATISDPTNQLMLQQTLDSARSTFQNVQKITSDLDALTGDPEFVENIRRLVNGLSGLVSSTERLQQHIQTAQTIEPMGASIAQMQQLVQALPPSAPAEGGAESDAAPTSPPPSPAVVSTPASSTPVKTKRPIGSTQP
jgi:phospholipid/cholesterol/gamma-HCH transport system substrate-binding protein